MLVRESYDGNIDAVKELLRAKNVDVNISFSKDGATPLLCASMKGHKDIIELLLNMKNIDVNKSTRMEQHHYILHHKMFIKI